MVYAHEIEVQERWFRELAKGTKTVEGRKGTSKWRQIPVGDVIKFVSPQQETFSCYIVKINWYPSVEEYLIKEGLVNTLPGVTTFQEGVDIYLKPNGFWDPEAIHKYGVLAFHVTRQ